MSALAKFSAPPIERMQYISRLLRARRTVNASRVARHFEMDRKTVQRDINFLRDRLGYEFEFNARLNSYVLTRAPEPVL